MIWSGCATICVFSSRWKTTTCGAPASIVNFTWRVFCGSSRPWRRPLLFIKHESWFCVSVMVFGVIWNSFCWCLDCLLMERFCDTIFYPSGDVRFSVGCIWWSPSGSELVSGDNVYYFSWWRRPCGEERKNGLEPNCQRRSKHAHTHIWCTTFCCDSPWSQLKWSGWTTSSCCVVEMQKINVRVCARKSSGR